MSYIDVPAKVLECFVVSQTGVGAWPFDDGSGDPYWKFGATPRDYQWRLVIQVNPQSHSSHKTRQPRVYNGMDIRVGDYVAASVDGVAVKIVRIERKTETELVCVVEDVFRYNTFRDTSGVGAGIFSIPSSALIFEVNDDGMPVVDPLPPNSVGPTFYPNLMSRFQNVEQNTNFLLYKFNHGFKVGQLIAADKVNNTFVLNDSEHPFLIGSVSFVHGPDHFTVNPIQRIIEGLDYLAGEVGDVLYADPSTPGSITVDSGLYPVMIKLREFTKTEIRGMVHNATTTAGSVLALNGVDIAIGGTGSIADLVTAVNAKSEDHGIIATEIPVPTEAATVFDLVNDYYGEPMVAIPALGQKPSARINSVLVTFSTFKEGQRLYGDTLAIASDMAHDINAANIPFVTARAEGQSLVISESRGNTITIQNIVSDARGHPFAGPGSASGLRTSTLGSSHKIAHLAAPDARAINVANVIGDPVADYGLYSTENGHKAAALYIEQGIRQATTTVVPNLASRDALPAMLADQAHVIDKGDGEWGLYLFDGTSWKMIASAETSKVDADTYSVVINKGDATVTIGELGPGSKVTQITIEVIEGFNNDASISVGDDSVPNRLASDDQIDLTEVGTYVVMPSYIYPEDGGDVLVKIFLVAPMSTTGRAKITLSYQ